MSRYVSSPEGREEGLGGWTIGPRHGGARRDCRGPAWRECRLRGWAEGLQSRQGRALNYSVPCSQGLQCRMRPIHICWIDNRIHEAALEEGRVIRGQKPRIPMLGGGWGAEFFTCLTLGRFSLSHLCQS